MVPYVQVEDLAVGYDGRVLLDGLGFQLARGDILTLIGPNGAGKSTILKPLPRQLRRLGGAVVLDGQEINTWSPKELARQLAVVLTDRPRPELLTCRELVALGRYPYTNLLDRHTAQDTAAVASALALVQAQDLADLPFATLSDGQRQRVLLARALCQQPKLLVLDEPTAYLDLRYKIEFLDILRTLARQEGITVLLSLHEIDLAAKVSDYLLCVREDRALSFGTPEELLSAGAVEALYGMSAGSYHPLLGSVELKKPTGPPTLFVVAGGGLGIPWYRALQKRRQAFAAGILFDNDVDCPVALALSDQVVTTPAFSPPTQALFQQAAALLTRCGRVLDAGTPVGPYNQANGQLLALAREQGLPVLDHLPD